MAGWKSEEWKNRLVMTARTSWGSQKMEGEKEKMEGVIRRVGCGVNTLYCNKGSKEYLDWD